MKPNLASKYTRGGTELKRQEKTSGEKQHPGVLKKGSEKDKKDEKIGLTKGEGFDIMAKLT